MPHPIAEDCRQIAVRQVAAEGEALVLRWQDADGQPVATAVVVRVGESATIGYRWRSGEDWHSIRQDVALCGVRTPRGGIYRQWRCPRGSAGATLASCTTL